MLTRTLKMTQSFLALSLLMALTLCSTTSFAEELDPTGKWDIMVDMAGEEIEAAMTVTKNEDGSYAGSLNSAMGDAEFDSVEFSDGELSFTQTFGEGDEALVFTFKGKLEKDTFTGMLNSDMGEMAVKGKRAVDVKIFGTWELHSSSELGELDHTLILNPDLSGTLDDMALADLSVSAKEITFEFEMLVDGETVLLSNEISIKKGELTGEVYLYGGSVADITGKYLNDTTTSKGNGHFGTWNIESTSEEGIQNHVFILKLDLTGTVDGLAVEDLVVSKGEISYSLTIPVSGDIMDLDIDISIDENTLEGEVFNYGENIADLSGKKADQQ